MKAKIMHGFMVVVLLFMQLMNLGGIQTAAATTPDQIEKVITTSNALDVNVTGTVQGDQINWALSYNKKDQGELRALKVRVSTDRDATLRLAPKANQLVQAMQGQDSQPKNQWWIEKAYSRSSQNVLYYSTPKTNNRLYVAVELNRREVAQTAQPTTTTVEAADAEADPDPLQTPVDSALTDTLVGPVEVLLPLSTATEEEQAVAIDRPAANTPQTEADAANTVDAVDEKVQATQGLLNANVYAKEYDRSQSFSLEDYRMPLDYTPVGTANGVYPTKAWAFKDNTNVKNHIGGNSQENKLYSNTGVVDVVDNTWLDYGANKSDPDFRIRKYAKETDVDGLFDVQLDIEGNSVEESEPMAIVLVLDYSQSMRNSRVENMKTGVENFLKDIKAAGYGDLVSVGVVGYSGGADPLFKVPVATINKNLTTIVNAMNRNPSGYTHTQAGLYHGSQMLKSTDIADRKMILLTDGVPTISSRATAARMYDANTVIGTAFNRSDQVQSPSGRVSVNLGSRSYKASGLDITTTWSSTTGEARLINEAGITLQALAIEIPENDYDSQKANTLAQMQKWVSRDQDGQLMFEEALTAGEITTYLDKQAKAVIHSFNTVSKGTVTDPLGAQFSYETDADGNMILPIVESDNKTATPVVTIDENHVKVSNLTLGENQKAHITYQVRINTEAEGFKADHWYPINGNTTFTAKEGTPTVDFGVPSAKAPSATYTVKKVWEDVPGAGVKPDELEVEIAREGTSFANEQTLTLTPNTWEGTFKDVAYGNQGQPLTYKVKAEVGADASYVSTQNYDSDTFKLTLTNVQYGVQVQKESTDSEYPVNTDDATFALNIYQDDLFIEVKEPSKSVTSLPQGLAEGFYGIKETVAPEGFELDPTEYLFRRDSKGNWSYYGARTDGSSVSDPVEIDHGMKLNQVEDEYDRFELENGTLLKLVKYNEPKRNLKLVLVKKGFMDSFLPDAKFTLTGPETETLTSVATAAGVTAETKLFGNDAYTLTEVEAPGGYEKLDATVSIQVNAKGTDATVKVDGQLLTSNGVAVEGYSYKLSGDTLTITAVNKLALQEMPVTGGPGLNAFIASALVLMVGATAAGLTLRYKKEQEGR